MGDDSLTPFFCCSNLFINMISNLYIIVSSILYLIFNMVSNVWCQRIPMVPNSMTTMTTAEAGGCWSTRFEWVNQRSFDWAMASIAKCNSHYQLISEISTDEFWKYRLEYCSVDVWIEESQEIWKMFDADRIFASLLHPLLDKKKCFPVYMSILLVYSILSICG